MGASSGGKARQPGQPAQRGLGQTYDPQVGGYGTGKPQASDGPTQFRGGRGTPQQASTGQNVDPLASYGVYNPGAVGGGKPVNAPTPLPAGEINPAGRGTTPDLSAIPRGETAPPATQAGRSANPLANALAVAPPVNTAQTTLNTMGLGNTPLVTGHPAPSLASLRVPVGPNTTQPTRSATPVPAAATQPPGDPISAVPTQAATQGTGPYDLNANGIPNWQANWQSQSQAAPTAAAPYGTDDSGTAFTSAAQAADWKQRVAARNAALSSYTFADQAADRGY